MIKNLKKIKIDNIISRFFATWFSTISIILTINNNFNDLSFLQNINLIPIIIMIIVIFTLCSLLNKYIKFINTDSLILLISYILCSFYWIGYNHNFLFLLSIIIFFSIIIIYFINKNNKIFKKITINKKQLIILLIIITFIPLTILTILSCLRYYNFSAPNYDFGIFSNIFYNLKNSLLPVSTCERDILLSHFAVHFSPILYLILPIYYVFSHPITLQIIQSLVLFSGIIPIVKLSKHYKLSNNLILIISILYCFYPALSCGCFFDFHENCFLPVCLLWLFYFFEKGKILPMYVMIILTFLIKEDAAIYIFIFALYILISRKRYIHGIIVLVLSIIYFLLASHIINTYGLGIMSDRFENLIYNDSGLIGAIKTIILNPGYVLTQVLATPTNNYEKIIYLLKMLLPLSFLPFITKRISRLILVLPFLINLLTNYSYQYDITFHYSFGILAFLFYISIQNLSELKFSSYSIILSIGLMICLSMYYNYVVPDLKNNISNWKIYKKHYVKIDKILKTIPEDASVSASTFLVPHLSNREEIYEVYYHNNKTDIDYVILDMRYEDNLDILEFYNDNKYEIVYEQQNYLYILKKTILKNSER